MCKSKNVNFPSVLLVLLVCYGIPANAEQTVVKEYVPVEDFSYLKTFDYMRIAKNYAEYMIHEGRDIYGKQKTPLFVSVIDRKRRASFKNWKEVPFPHVRSKPWAPGIMRLHKRRPYDWPYTGADPLRDLPLYNLLYRLTEITSEKKYAREADRSIKWFLENAQSPVTGLYPWGTHMHWNVHTDTWAYNANQGYGGHEYNFVWRYWDQNPEQLRKFAHGLWDNQIHDKKTGRFDRHARYHKRGIGGNLFEFPQTGSCYINTWAREFSRSGDPEMKRAITALLNLFQSMRHPKTRSLSWCTSSAPGRRERCQNAMNLSAATNIQDGAALVESRDPELAESMRQFARDTDDEFLSHDYDSILDVAGKGLLTAYHVATGQPLQKTVITAPADVEDPSIGYPLKDKKGRPTASSAYGSTWIKPYAVFAGLLYNRYLRCEAKHKPLYRRAVLETANIYMTIEPEVQWVVNSDNVACVMELLRNAYRITNNPMYLRRADHLAQLAVRLFFDETSPLPKMSSFDDFYEFRVEIIYQMVELVQDMKSLPEKERTTAVIALQPQADFGAASAAGDYAAAEFQADLKDACATGMGGVWDGAGVKKNSKDLYVAYGGGRQKRKLYLSQEDGIFSANRQAAAALDISASDVINKIPTAEEADRVNDPRMTKFEGRVLDQAKGRYAGFKDVLKSCGLTVSNPSDQEQHVTLKAILHDTYHDNGSVTVTGKVPAGSTMFFGAKASARKYIRKLHVRSNNGTPLRIDKMGFVMVKRNALK